MGCLNLRPFDIWSIAVPLAYNIPPHPCRISLIICQSSILKTEILFEHFTRAENLFVMGLEFQSKIVQSCQDGDYP